MKVNWLLDTVALGPIHDELAQAVIECGHKATSATRPNPPYDWDDVDSNFFEAIPAGSCTVISGDIDMVTRVRSNPIWTPGVFAKVEEYFCSNYYVHFGKYVLNGDYLMLPFGELDRRSDFLFATLGNEDQLFVRPDSSLKLFTGQTISKSTFKKDLEFLEFSEPASNDLVVISSPKNVVTEWRFVVVDRKVVTGSLYKNQGQLVTELVEQSPARNFAQRVCNDVKPHPQRVWILDICMTADSKLHVIEVGGFSFAGLYACDKVKIVEEVSRVAMEMHAR